MMSAKIPATVITGFLGAGKTTVIRTLLENADGRRIGLVINEFGDIGIDAEVLKGCGDPLCRDDDIVELANGCICCTVADDFLPALTRLIERDEPPEHIIIETSGLALPQPLVRAFNWPEIRARVTVDGVVTVVDGAAVGEGRFAGDEEAVQAQREADEALDHESPLEELFEDQLACADMILLNKADLLQGDALATIEADLKAKVRPSVNVLRTSHGALPADVLLGMTAEAESDMDARKSHHELAGEDDHDHDDFESFIIEGGRIADREAFLEAVAQALGTHDILRLKGLVAVEGADARLVIQAVGPRLSSYYDRPWAPGEPRASTLVVIGETGLDQGAIRAALKI